MKINILFLIDSLQYGGAEKQLVELIENLDSNLYSLHICCLKPSGPLYDELTIPKTTLSYKRFGSLSVIPVVRELVSYIKKNNIQIVQTFFQDPFLLAALSSYFCSFKLIGTFLDLGFWRTPLESCKMRFAYRYFDGFIANSEAVKNHFVHVDRLDPLKVRIIYNGFDYSKVEKVAAPTGNASGPCIGIVANLNRPVKRVDDFIMAAALVKKRCPESRFLIAGDGHLRPELERLAADLGISGSTSFVGRVANPLDYIKTMSVGVICSETEGFSNSIIEYMACEVPVVVTAVGGNPELVKDGVNGFLVPVAEPEQLADRICRILESPELHRQMGIRNRDLVKNNFSIDYMCNEYGSYYQQVASGNNP